MRVSRTKLQKKLYDIIAEKIESDGVGPSIKELTVAMGLKSNSRVHQMIRDLKERGWIDYLPYKARSITLRRPQASSSLSDLVNTKDPNVYNFLIESGWTPPEKSNDEKTICLCGCHK